MSIGRILTLLTQDLRMGPRSPIFIWAILTPVLITFILQIVFLTLFDPIPRLGLVDQGHSEITAALKQMEGIDLTLAKSPADLKTLVQRHDVDAGLVLAKGFDEAVRTGKKPMLAFTVAGESRAINRIVLSVTAIDLVRKVENRPDPVNVVLHTTGNRHQLSISKRLVPAIVLFVLIMAGLFVPAFNLVQEREQGTLHALLVTPVRMSEVLVAKALLGLVMALLMAYLTLALNGALAAEPVALLTSLAVAAIVCIEIGLIYGTIAKDAKSLYTLVKTLNLLLIGPVIFYIFPDWPQWIAKLFPTYWFIDPVYRIALRGASLSDVGSDLAVALGIGAALVVPIFFLGKRLQARLAIE